MIGEIFLILGMEVRTDQGTFRRSDFQGHVKEGAKFNTETMKIVTGAAEECEA